MTLVHRDTICYSVPTSKFSHSPVFLDSTKPESVCLRACVSETEDKKMIEMCPSLLITPTNFLIPDETQYKNHI